MLRAMTGFFDDEEPSPGDATAVAAPPVAAAVGKELRAARERTRLSLRTAAARIGISRGYLSKAENGHVAPSWDVLTRIAAAYDCEPRLRLLRSRDSIEALARSMATMTPRQRLAGHENEAEPALRLLVEHAVAFVVTGAVAGVLQGLPMTIDELLVAVRGDDDTMTALVDVLMRATVLYRELEPDEMRRECAGTWLVGWCSVRFEVVDELPDATDVMVGDMPVPVLPLTVLVAQDRDAGDVFDTVRSILSG